MTERSFLGDKYVRNSSCSSVIEVKHRGLLKVYVDDFGFQAQVVEDQCRAGRIVYEVARKIC